MRLQRQREAVANNQPVETVVQPPLMEIPGSGLGAENVSCFAIWKDCVQSWGSILKRPEGSYLIMDTLPYGMETNETLPFDVMQLEPSGTPPKTNLSDPSPNTMRAMHARGRMPKSAASSLGSLPALPAPEVTSPPAEAPVTPAPPDEAPMVPADPERRVGAETATVNQDMVSIESTGLIFR